MLFDQRLQIWANMDEEAHSPKGRSGPKIGILNGYPDAAIQALVTRNYPHFPCLILGGRSNNGLVQRLRKLRELPGRAAIRMSAASGFPDADWHNACGNCGNSSCRACSLGERRATLHIRACMRAEFSV
jgi:hypothetical protein